jgi:hypothetical protein
MIVLLQGEANECPRLPCMCVRRLCPNSTGADIRSVCTEAGMYAIRARRKTVTEKDFLDAVNKVLCLIRIAVCHLSCSLCLTRFVPVTCPPCLHAAARLAPDLLPAWSLPPCSGIAEAGDVTGDIVAATCMAARWAAAGAGAIVRLRVGRRLLW